MLMQIARMAKEAWVKEYISPWVIANENGEGEVGRILVAMTAGLS
jgi:hypothetical protein